ncbi:XRE family transcriptional regulator [Solitalea koreensis]|uniref:Helix-turn-helix n=1 Tax=Solitalea koreensis TaxID=543615 RepID=A0A521D8V5_9SPHI|nr:LexA family transcriptional regulator [Solitalea koreensis]SMO68134.1 Helix-turn-helix [Solitalea koreensis]
MNTEFEYNRLRIAREQLGLTQKEAANSSGISQRDISQLESGIKKFFLLPYILFLNNNGINLNILFSNELNIQNLIIQKPTKITAIDPLNIQFDTNRFKYSRERAGLTQKQAADRSGLSQRDISQLESGQKKFIPIQYILFLTNIKADLNVIFRHRTSEPINSPSSSKIVEKPVEKPVQNKAPENRIFNAQLSIGAEYSKEIELEKSLETTPSNPLFTKEVKIEESVVKPAPLPVEPIAKKVEPTSISGIKFISIDEHDNYLKKHKDKTYLNTLPSISIPGYDKKLFRAFELQGRAMEPIFFEHDIVIASWLENKKQVENNQLYVLITNKEIVLRRLINCLDSSGEFILLSDNEKSSSQVISNDNVMEIWKFRTKITSSVDNLKAGFNELYYQLLKIQKELESIRTKLDK